MRYLKTPALQSFCRLLASSFLIAEALARELIGAFVRNRYSSPQSCMALISGLSDSPALEREYSTFGGTTGYTAPLGHAGRAFGQAGNRERGREKIRLWLSASTGYGHNSDVRPAAQAK